MQFKSPLRRGFFVYEIYNFCACSFRKCTKNVQKVQILLFKMKIQRYNATDQ